jgi:hypothetical protein
LREFESFQTTIAEAVEYPGGMGAASTISFSQVGSLQYPDADQLSLGRCKVSFSAENPASSPLTSHRAPRLPYMTFDKPWIIVRSSSHYPKIIPDIILSTLRVAGNYERRSILG